MTSNVALEHACEFVTDGTHYTPKNIGAGVPFLTVKDVNDRAIDLAGCSFISEADYLAAKAANSAPRRGDVLFSKDGTVGKVHVVATDHPFAVLSSLAILRPRYDITDAGYLGHALRSPAAFDQALKKKTGSAIRRIVLSDLRQVRVPLPPLPEQRRIAAILDQADALRTKRREALTQLDSLTQSIFTEMFGDPARNTKGWSEVTIADICEVKGEKRLPKGEDYSATPTSFRYIRVTDIRSGSVDESKLVFLTPEVQSTISRYIVNAGDVIISIAGSIGLIAPVFTPLAGANLTENAAKLVPRANAPLYDHVFLAKALQTPFSQDQISSHVGQVTIGKLALFRIEKVRLPLPPIDAQRRFARSVEAVARLRRVHQASTDEVDALFASLQHRAFAGQLS